MLENTRLIAVGAHFTHTYKKELKKSTFRISGKIIRSADTLGAMLARKRLKEKMNNKNKQEKQAFRLNEMLTLKKHTLKKAKRRGA